MSHPAPRPAQTSGRCPTAGVSTPAIGRDRQSAEPVTGVLRSRIVVQPPGGAPGPTAIGAAAEHHVGPIAWVIGDAAQRIDIAARWAAGTIRREPGLAPQTLWVYSRNRIEHRAAKVHLHRQIEGRRDASVLGVGRAVYPEIHAIGAHGINLAAGPNVERAPVAQLRDGDGVEPGQAAVC